MKPALSAEEWAEYNNPVVFTDQHVESGCCSCDLGDRHSLAARCLRGQEYGFTREMATVMRFMASMSMQQSLRIHGLPSTWPTTGQFFSDVADRIEALLPPEG